MRTETDVKIEDGKKRSDDKLTSLKTGRKVCFYYHPFSALLAPAVKTGIFTAEMCPKELKNSAKNCRKCLRDGHIAANCSNDNVYLQCDNTGHRSGESRMPDATTSTPSVQPTAHPP